MAPKRPMITTPKETSSSLPSPIEPSIEQNYNGVHLNYEYNINIPVWLLGKLCAGS